MPAVTYIPSQTVDESAFTSNRASVLSPWNLFFHDALVLFRNLKYVFKIILPIRIPAHRHGVRYHLAPIVANETLLAISIAYEIVLLFVGSPAILVLPGWAFLVFFLITTWIVVLLAAPGWGSRTVQSRNRRVPLNNFPHEKWIFMNGLAQSHLDLQFTVDNLSATFGRPFLGIHNRSLGFVWDIGECLIQRCFGYSNEDVRICYDELRISLLDPSITKIIVIAHSQGAIILSLTIDRMFAELPATSMSKLEIYTFGSAAAHFNNPLKFQSQIDPTLRPRDALDEKHNHRRRPRRKEEQLTSPTKSLQSDPLPETTGSRQRAPSVLEQPSMKGTTRSPGSISAVKGSEATTMDVSTEQPLRAPYIFDEPISGEPSKSILPDPFVRSPEAITPPIDTLQPQQVPSIVGHPFEPSLVESPLMLQTSESNEDVTRLEIPIQNQPQPQVQEPLNANTPARPASNPRPTARLAEAIVDTATAGSRSFFWRPSSQHNSKVVEQNERRDVDQTKRSSSGDVHDFSLVSARGDAYDGAQGSTSHKQKYVPGHVNEGDEHVIPVIEHYCNEFDMVPRWGVLANVQYQPQHRYAGSVFIHRQTSGHLFNRHYLDTMFPMDLKAQHFLDQIVDVDIQTAKARAGALVSSITSVPGAESDSRSWVLYDSITEILSPSSIFARAFAALLYLHLRLTTLSWMGTPSFGQTTKALREGIDLMARDENEVDSENPSADSIEKVKALADTVGKLDTDIAIEGGNGQTVRQLSKLWRYMHGGAA